MNWIKELWRRIAHLRKRDEAEAHLAEEMRLHLELKAAAVGDASAARREFGNVTRLKEESREAWGWSWLDSLAQDLKYGWRNLMASRGFTVTAILSLALGIGANTAIFSIVNAVMLRSLPVPDPHRLVLVQRGGSDHLTNPLFEAIRDHQNAFTGTFAYGDERFDLAQEGEKQLVNGLYVSGQFFETLKVPAFRGRVLTPEDDLRGGGKFGAVAVISHGFWQSHYAGDPAILGKMIRLNGHAFQIVGVTPPHFTGMQVDKSFSVAIPLCTEPKFRGEGSGLDNRSFWWLRVVGRLQPGITLEQANERLKAVSAEVNRLTTPDWDEKQKAGYQQATLGVVSAEKGFSGARGEGRTALFAMMGVVAIALLIACANIANLLLARAAARQQEISVRMAIGAARRRLVRQLMTESLLLAALGIPFGLLLAKWGSKLLVTMISTGRNRLELDTTLDGKVLLFTVGVSLLTGLLFGLAPALRATRVSTNEILKQTTRGGGGGKFRLGKALVAGQVALSLALLVGAGLFVTTLRNLMNVPLGFKDEGLLTVRTDLNGKVPKAERLERIRLMKEEMQQVAGVRSVATAFVTPISGVGWNGMLFKEGSPNAASPERDRDLSFFNRVSPDYFGTMQTPLLMGREFNERDTVASAKVMILTEKTARHLFGDEMPIGKRTMMHAGPGGFENYEVVGVVGDSKYQRVKEETRRIAYVPSGQDANPSDKPTFMVRYEGAAGTVTPALRKAMTAVSPGVSLEFHRLDVMIRDSLSQQRLVAWLVGFFGLLALGLAVVGLYGVTSYTAAQRKGEIGIRMALGAQRGSVVWLVLRDVTIILAIGSVLGIMMSFGVGRFVASLMYGVEPGDLGTMIGAAVLLGVAGVMAGLLPAWRASKLDPAMALRCE